MNEKLEKLLNEYRERFDDAFPMMLCRSMEEDEIISMVQKCLDDDEPYEPELNNEAFY